MQSLLKRVFLSVGLLGLGLAALCLGQLNQPPPEPVPGQVRIAVGLPLDIAVGREMLNAAYLAIDHAGGSVQGQAVELLPLDTANPEGQFYTTERDIVAAEQAISDPQVLAYIGAANSSAARDLIPIFNEAGMVLVSPSATAPSLTKAGFVPGEPAIYYPSGQRNFFRVTPSDEVQGAAAARWLDAQGWTRIFVIENDTHYAQGILGILEATALDLNLRIVGRGWLGLGVEAAQVEALLRAVEAARPELVYMPAVTGQGAYDFVLALRQRLPQVAIMGADGLANEVLPADRAALEGIYATNIAPQLEPQGAATPFVNAYEARFGTTPGPLALLTYEATNAVLHALAQASVPSRQGLLEAMHHLELYGEMGIWHFDENGDIDRYSISILQLQDGRWNTIDRVP